MAVVTYETLMLSSFTCAGWAGALGAVGADVEAEAEAFVKYVFATKPVCEPYLMCDHVPSTFKTVTVCPFGIVTRTRALVDFEARKFKLAVVFDVVAALGVTTVATGFGAAGTTGFGAAETWLKKSLCTQPVFPLYVTCDQAPLVLSGVSVCPFGMVRRALCVVPAPARRFKLAVVVRLTCVVVLVAVSVTGPDDSFNVCPMAMRSDDKLFTDFNVESDTLCCWLIDQSVSPARTVWVLAAEISSVWERTVIAAIAANEYMRPDL